MSVFKQDIRFTHSADGTRLAYASFGEGYPLVRAAHWFTDIEYDWQTPMFRASFDAFGSRYRYIRYDSRGTGLSERGKVALSLDHFVADLEAVVDAAGLDKFALWGNPPAARYRSNTLRATPNALATLCSLAPTRADQCGAIRRPRKWKRCKHKPS